MSSLSAEQCDACRADAPRVSDEELAELIREIPEWVPQSRDGVLQLERTFSFPDFRSAMGFANAVGELAEQVGHHPAILLEWGKVTVTWWTHKIGGLHRNDFIMAARTDALPGATG